MSLKFDLFSNRHAALADAITPEIQDEAKDIIESNIIPLFKEINKKYPLRKRIPIYVDFSSANFFILKTFTADAIEGGSKTIFYKHLLQPPFPLHHLWYAIMELAEKYEFSADEANDSLTKMIFTMIIPSEWEEKDAIPYAPYFWS